MKRSAKRRSLRFEPLEQRLPLAGDSFTSQFSNWHNESNSTDVNGSGEVTPIDALIVINAINRFGVGSVDTIQADLHASNALAKNLYRGYFPDVSRDGWLSAFDVLRVFNQLSGSRKYEGPVPILVRGDDQGKPLSIVYTEEDGRTIEVDVSQQDVLIHRSGDDDVFAANADGVILVIARPGVGVLETDYSADNGQAIVTRLEAEGKKSNRRYDHVPRVRLFEKLDLDLDCRVPINGFEEVIGYFFETKTVYPDGSVFGVFAARAPCGSPATRT